MYFWRSGGVCNVARVLNRDYILLCFWTRVLMEVRKWSWVVVLVNMMSQWGHRNSFENCTVPVGRRGCMNRLVNIFWVVKLADTRGMIHPIDSKYCWYCPVVFSCKKIFGNAWVRRVSYLAVDAVRDVFFSDVDCKRRCKKMNVDWFTCMVCCYFVCLDIEFSRQRQLIVWTIVILVTVYVVEFVVDWGECRPSCSVSLYMYLK